ncbi:MAG: LON peptidase substrate-binding domain-containing protein [Alphaproteobacteria bacterium]|nr:LON peptidase substrate-binding domain-containing protein [Alphaproteobacteria bacterium]
METNPFAPRFEDLPETLPVFPLPGVLLLPAGHLPLNIFEPRYLKMVQDVLGGNRLIGMIQPKHPDKPEIYDTGCAGKITEFTETSDGRYLITLTGICRFHVVQELKTVLPYRQVKAGWQPFRSDLDTVGCLNLDRKKLHTLLQSYFKTEGLDCEWERIEKATDGRLITCLSMVCPFDAKEKQALLEAPDCKSRADMFMTMLEMAVLAGKTAEPCKSSH